MKSMTDPTVGIWWDDGDTVVAFSHSPTENATRTGNLLDSNLTHADQWKSAAKRLGKRLEDEYFEVPRGRVLLNARSKQGIILHGPATPADRLQQIANEFHLTNWRAEVDSHYFTGSDADRLFEDDES